MWVNAQTDDELMHITIYSHDHVWTRADRTTLILARAELSTRHLTTNNSPLEAKLSIRTPNMSSRFGQIISNRLLLRGKHGFDEHVGSLISEQLRIIETLFSFSLSFSRDMYLTRYSRCDWLIPIETHIFQFVMQWIPCR